MNRDVIRQGVNILALIATLIVNFLSNALPINGQTAAQIANRLPILFVPANYVFSVWGVNYILLIGFTIYQALPAQRENPLLRRVGYWFALSCAANIIWLFLFHYNQFALSMVAMIVLLVALITIYRRVHSGNVFSTADRIWVQGTFSVYLGWITVATVANAAYVLFDAGWDGFGIAATTWTIIMLLVATAITGYMILTYADWAYAAVIVWALVGIVVKQVDTQVVALTAGAMIVVVVGTLAVMFFRRGGLSSGTPAAA
jgi:benzodiazapine receptor